MMNGNSQHGGHSNGSNGRANQDEDDHDYRGKSDGHHEDPNHVEVGDFLSRPRQFSCAAKQRGVLRKAKSEMVMDVSSAAGRRFDGGTSPISKHGLHFAVATGQRTPGNPGSSSSTPHIIAMVSST